MLGLARSERKLFGGAPEGQERLLHGVLGQGRIAHDAEGEAVREPAVAVVQLGERALVLVRREREQRLVGEVRVVAGRESSGAARLDPEFGAHSGRDTPMIVVGWSVTPPARSSERPTWAPLGTRRASSDRRPARSPAEEAGRPGGLAVDHPELVRLAGRCAREARDERRPGRSAPRRPRSPCRARCASTRGWRARARAAFFVSSEFDRLDAQRPSTIAAATAPTARPARTAGEEPPTSRRRSGRGRLLRARRLVVDALEQPLAQRGRGRRALGHVGERRAASLQALELARALLAAREVLLELAPLGIVECVQDVRRD